MHVHILAICGTFMGGVARLAKELGHRVSGSDANVYPPMSEQLESVGIELMEGYSEDNLSPRPDLVVIGNAMSRGNPEVEAVLNMGLPYMSGPQWLAENVLRDKWVIAVAGTHGKTTCSSLLAWILEDAGMNPGFLIGGVPENFHTSARLGDSPFFVVEADEYDTAFFDKRSKFVHYRPRTAILNNLEFDHADIFPDLEAIKTQFHQLVRTVPQNGLLLCNADDDNLKDTLARGCWTGREYFTTNTAFELAAWTATAEDINKGSEFTVTTPEGQAHKVSWSLSGAHNVMNALAVLAAARHVGVPVAIALEGLSRFAGVKRRMETIARVNGVTVYDDFAHHPTAIQTTLGGLRAQVGRNNIIAVLEMRSNTMRMGYHKENVLASLKDADLAIIYTPNQEIASNLGGSGPEIDYPNTTLINTVDDLLERLRKEAIDNTHIVIMSNGAFEGLHGKLTAMLQTL